MVSEEGQEKIETQQLITNDTPLSQPTTERLITKELRNVLVSGLVLCLVYSGFFPGQGILAVVLADADSGLTETDGFISSGLVFLGSFLGSLVSPAVIKKIGNRASLGLATILYTGQFLGVILLQAWAIFLGSCVSGLGMGLEWVICLKILNDNSTNDNLQRNTSIWWGIYISSLLIGNVAEYCYLGNLSHIDTVTRVTIYVVCCILILLASLIGVFGYQNIEAKAGNEPSLVKAGNEPSLVKAGNEPSLAKADESQRTQVQDEHPDGNRFFNKSERYRDIIFRKSVGFVVVTVAYNSLVMAFYTMTLETCIGNTFTYRKLIPLMGIVFGIAEITGSLIFEKLCKKFSNQCLVIVLFTLSLTAFYLAFLTFSPECTSSTSHSSYLTPRQSIIMVISVLLGVADAGYNILSASFMGLLFRDESEVGFMILNSTLSLGTALAFFVSSHLSVYTILGIKVLFCVPTTMFIVLDMIR